MKTARWYGAIATAAMIAACNSNQPPVSRSAQAAGGRPTPAPTFAGDPDSASWSDIAAYVATLTFDTTAPAADNQFLLTGRGAVGPWASGAPEIGAHLVDSAALARGRIIARIYTSGPYVPLALPGDTVYIWAQTKSAGDRFLVIPKGLTGPIIEKAMTIIQHNSGFRWRTQYCGIASLAFKVEAGNGLSTQECYCCGSNGWCESPHDTTRTRVRILPGGVREPFTYVVPAALVNPAPERRPR